MKNQHNVKAFLYDIVECANNCIEFIGDVSFEEFENDERTLSAVLYQMMIIGEATKKLGSEFTRGYTHIPWKKMAGMRDVLIHNYEKCDVKIPWMVIKNELPSLIKNLEQIIEELG